MAETGRVTGRDPTRVGVRELRQNLSVYLRRVEAGESFEVTDHGRPVARLVPEPPARMSVLDRLIAEGRATRATRPIEDLPPPRKLGPGPTVTEILLQMREEDDR
jgi:prevent-host-death family protein